MENSILSHQELKKMEEAMIQTIIKDYFEFRNFFEIEVTYDTDSEIVKTKKDLLKSKSKQFYENYYSHPLVLSGERAEKILASDSVVLISFKDVAFVYPKSFVRYMDRLQDNNTISIRTIDMSLLDDYMHVYPIEQGIEIFFERFFQIVKKFQIALRPREVDLLKLYTDIRFISETSTGTKRYYPPRTTEILKIFGLKKKSILQVSRADNFLYNNRICYLTSIIMNPAKFGFTFAAIDYPTDYPELVDGLRPFCIWEMNFRYFSTLIVCVPLGNTDELLNDLNYILLDNWNWNLNFQHFNPIKYDTSKAWTTFDIPNLSRDTRLSHYISWNIIPERVEFSSNEIEIIRKLSGTNVINLQSYDNLSKALSPSGTREIVKKLFNKDVCQLYPRFNHIDLHNLLILRIETKNNKLFEKIISNLLTLPIVHVLTNKSEGLIYTYANLPSKSVPNLIFELKGLKTINPRIKIDVANVLDSYYISHILNLNKISFKVKNGTAFLS